MKVSGTSMLSADREAVWRALNDPAVLVRTIPGCQRLESLGEDTYRMTIAAGVGSVRGVYDGEVRLTELAHPGSFRMLARGTGAPGTIGAEVVVTLDEGPEGCTSLCYDADATVGGMIGGVGQRMLTGVSRKMAEEFFANVESLLAEGAFPGALGEPSEPPAVLASPVAASASGTAAVGEVFTAPGSAGIRGGRGFALGVLAGATAALAGALVGGFIARRTRG